MIYNEVGIYISTIIYFLNSEFFKFLNFKNLIFKLKTRLMIILIYSPIIVYTISC